MEGGFRREAAEEAMDRGDDLLNIAVEPVGQHLLFQAPPDFLHGILTMARVLRQETQLDAAVRGAPRPDQLGRVDARVIEHQVERDARIGCHEGVEEGHEVDGPFPVRHRVVPRPGLPGQGAKDAGLPIGPGRHYVGLLAAAHPHGDGAQDRQQVHIASIETEHHRIGTRLPEPDGQGVHRLSRGGIGGQDELGAAPACRRTPKFPRV